MARIGKLQRLSMRNVASAHHVPGEFGAAEEGPSELLAVGRRLTSCGGMICMSCAEKAVRAAIEEDRALLLCEAQKQNGADELLREATPSVLKSRA